MTFSLTGFTASARLFSSPPTSSANEASVFSAPCLLRFDRRVTRKSRPLTRKSRHTDITSRPCEMNSPMPCLPIRGTSP